jgi:MinD-like ATPase involved in chromosome partitioning or flagellar assembly
MKIFIGQMVDPHNESSKMVLFNDLISQLEEKSPERIKLFREEFSPERYKLCVIANAVRNVAQASVTEKFVKIVKRYLSLSIRELGSLPYEPMMDAAICQRVPFIVKYPESLYAANMREIARLIPLYGNGKQP